MTYNSSSILLLYLVGYGYYRLPRYVFVSCEEYKWVAHGQINQH